MSLRKAALIAGITMFIIAIFAAFAVGVVGTRLIVDGDATATMSNIKKSISLFQAGIFSWLVILICDIVISLALYIFLKQIDRSLSLLGAWFRLAYSAVLGIAILNLVLVSILLSRDHEILFYQTDQLKSLLMLFVIAFHKMWSLGLIIFGFHLFIIGCLVMKSSFIPRFFGILLFIASFSYMFIHIMHLFLPQYENTTRIIENILSLPMALGELGLGIWMLVKGGKTP
ncbi:MAG: DUF4386 domain-containing protein [Candidatus Methanofastidiosa archaeon]|nr:DUF4386 domain-containing protein [Candidatus Methanofastidiosa archaeon]